MTLQVLFVGMKNLFQLSRGESILFKSVEGSNNPAHIDSLLSSLQSDISLDRAFQGCYFSCLQFKTQGQFKTSNTYLLNRDIGTFYHGCRAILHVRQASPVFRSYCKCRIIESSDSR